MDKEWKIKIGGIQESVENLTTLKEVLSSIERKVNTVNSNGGFTVSSKESKKAMDELARLTQKITQYDKEYQIAVEASKGVLKDRNNEVKQLIELEKANIIVQEGAKSTYYEKQQLLSALGKQIKSMNADTDEEKQKQQELISQYTELNKELKDFDASLGNHQRNVGDYKNSIKEAAEELRDIGAEANEAQERLAQMIYEGKGGTKEFEELAKKAGELKRADELADQAMERHISTMKGLDDVINIAQSATAAFELYTGAMSAFGLESEGATEAMQKMMSAMSIIQSLQTLQETLTGNTASATLFNKALKVTGVELITTQLASIKATAAQEGLSTAQKAGAVASKTLGLALKAIPLMFIIGLVATLVTHWQDIVGWFEKTFPVLKSMGGAMNALKGVIIGVGKAVVHWLVNPFETFAKVIKKIMAGDFTGAVKEAVDGVKNQFTGLGDAFKKGFQSQVQRGMEDMTRKASEEMDKTLTHQKNMITKQKNADGTYRKEYIEANKKMFANRKKMYQKDSDEYRKVLEEEAAFNQQIEDAKTGAVKKSSSERIKAVKEASDAAKKVAQETENAIKEAEEELKRYNDVSYEYTSNRLDELSLESKQKERIQKRKLESYSSGPIERYLEEREKLAEIQDEINNIEYTKQIADISKALTDNIKNLDKTSEAWQRFKKELYEDNKNYNLDNGLTIEEAEEKAKKTASDMIEIWKHMYFKLITMSDEERDALFDSLGYKKQIEEETAKLSAATSEKEKAEAKKRINILKTEQTNIINSWQKVFNLLMKAEDDKNAYKIESQNSELAVMKNELDDFANDAERSYEMLMKRIKEVNVEPVAKDNIWGKLFGAVDEKETLEKYERIKKMWSRAYDEIQSVLKKSEHNWEIYVGYVAHVYGEDSIQYKKATQEKMDALEKLRKKAIEVGKVASAPTSMNGDLNADGKSDTPSGGTTSYGGSMQRGLGKFNEFFNKINDTLLAPAMDTFSMFMDFAIEETAQKLEQVQELHDKAMDKVNESADKIKELNEKLRDSGDDNTEATKQQLADEQLLYAQRLAEERKLAEEEKNLKNKQAQQEAAARKMELRYQMVMAIANTAQGASKALATWGWPLGAIFAGIMTALGAVQVGLIAKQIGAIKPVKYAEGGIISGKPHSQGGVPVGNTNIEVEGGEMIVSKRNTERYRDVLYKINNNDPSVRYLQGNTRQYADAKIRRYASGGELNFDRADESLRTQQDTSKLMAAIGSINMNPIVTVKDIWKAEDRLVKVRALSGRNEKF